MIGSYKKTMSKGDRVACRIVPNSTRRWILSVKQITKDKAAIHEKYSKLQCKMNTHTHTHTHIPVDTKLR